MDVVTAEWNLCTGGLNSYLQWKLYAPQARNIYVRTSVPKMPCEERALLSLRRLDPQFDCLVVDGPNLSGLEVGGGYVIPCRNAVLLSLAAAHAVASDSSVRAVRLLFGVPDGETVSDKAPDFMAALASALQISCSPQSWTPGVHIDVLSRLRGEPKCEHVRRYVALGLPPEVLAETWSCNVPGGTHCGRCESCAKRRAAFCGAGCQDPTVYINEGV